MNTFNLKVLLVLLLLMGANGCSKSPLTQHDWGEGIENFAPARLLSNADGRYNHWQSIARVKVDEGRICSGSLIDTRGANDDRSGPAYVLTSGHCAKGNVGRFIVNEPASGQATFNFFRDTTPQQKNYPITRIAWSTLRGQDIALLVLDRTLGQVMNDGIQPLKVASHALTEGTDTLVVGAAVDDFIQRSACPQEHRAGILEAGWVWVDQISNRCLGVINGISGSPLLNRYTNEIVAVIGTTTRDSGRSRCSISAPCEVIEGMPNKARDTNYATPANGLDTCFRGGRFVGDREPCVLGPVSEFGSKYGDHFLKQPRDEQGNYLPLLWEHRFSSNQPFFRFKYTRTAENCADIRDYSAVRTTDSGGESELRYELRQGPGLYFLCVMGQNHQAGPPGKWDARNARIFWRWVLAEPAQMAPVFNITNRGEGVYSVAPSQVTPDLDVAGHQYKIGTSATIDCQQAEGYKQVRPPLLDFEVDTSDGEKKICLKTVDMAGNPSPVIDFRLPDAAP
ncbi:trypsin-like serine peptidase [Pseudomonas sp. LjRoot263]|uniref:trypsin-like serine peptidase n=1 Tax=Pseudomonas sp. LjRoot263 TaxID=3342302 RepID=UPI003ECE95EF